MPRLRSIKLLKQKKKADFSLAIVSLLLSLFGVLMIYEASSVTAARQFNDKFFFARNQLLFLAIGAIVMIIASFIPYKKYSKLSFPLFLLSILFLIAVFVPGIGIEAQGASRWLNFGLFSFQPTELVKIALILYLSFWLKKESRGKFVLFLLLTSLIAGLVVLQPDLGTAIIIFLISVSIYFISEAPLWHFLLLVPMFFVSGLALAITSPYRLRRLTTFLEPSIDPLGASYHIRQILISLGSGGLMGVGLGNSRQKYEFLPEATSDSIFAIIGEELGFIGASVLVLVFVYFLFKIYKITTHSPDRLSFLISSGTLIFFLSHLIINIGSQTALLPLTGSSLPLISYGGSNLIMSFWAIGIILNISRYRVSK